MRELRRMKSLFDYDVALVYFDFMNIRQMNGTMAKRENKRPAIRKIHINLPEEVHLKLRVKCALEDMTMQDWVAELIQRELVDVPLVGGGGRRIVRNG
ncbi:MAG: hypothetical protein JRJ69_15480 [Deltaproteobacteria bacterium]|nr:hypothetical protein [Deltaproteobacteria bacterium]